MLNKDNVLNVVDKLKMLDPNDPEIENCWKQLVVEFTNESETIEFLQSCTEEAIYWVSSIFDDLAYKFPSRKYVEAIKQLAKKFPNVDMSLEIEIAESYIS